MNKWNTQDIELAIELIKNGLNYSDIAQKLNRSIKSVKLKLNKLGYKTSKFKIEKLIKFCEYCDSIIENAGTKYCSSSCAAKVNNTLYPKRTKLDSSQDEKHIKKIRVLKIQNFCLYCGEACVAKYCNISCHHNLLRENNIKEWKCGNKLGYTGKTKQIRNFIRQYLLEKYDYKCHKCGWNERNPITGSIPLEVNHIDGNAENCKEENLEIICPNCHSLTDNFRALNKNSKRNRKSPCET